MIAVSLFYNIFKRLAATVTNISWNKNAGACTRSRWWKIRKWWEFLTPVCLFNNFTLFPLLSLWHPVCLISFFSGVHIGSEYYFHLGICGLMPQSGSRNLNFYYEVNVMSDVLWIGQYNLFLPGHVTAIILLINTWFFKCTVLCLLLRHNWDSLCGLLNILY